MPRPLHFRHLTKTAGTSINSFLRSSCPERLPFFRLRPIFLGDCQPWDKICPDRPDDLLLFGVVRNPESHVRSVHRQFFSRDMSLNEMIKSELWMLSVSEMLSDCEFIIQFENLSTEWLEFCKYANLPIGPLPHHRNQRHIPVSKDEFDNKSKDIINHHYEWVYNNFNYKRLK